MPGPPFGPFVDDDDDVARLDPVGEDGVAGGVLRVEDARRALELPDRSRRRPRSSRCSRRRRCCRGARRARRPCCRRARRRGCSPSRRRRRARRSTCPARTPTFVGTPPGAASARCLRRGRRGRRGGCRSASIASPMRRRVHGADVAVDEPGAVELAEDREDAAGAVHVLDVVVRRRRDLADVRHPARQPVDVAACVKSRRPRARWRGCAARCWSSRPWRCRASSRSRTPRTWRCCAAAREQSPST